MIIDTLVMGNLSYQVRYTLASQTLLYLCVRRTPRPVFPTSYALSSFCVQRTKMRADCSFWWYLGNCWPSLFTLFIL